MSARLRDPVLSREGFRLLGAAAAGGFAGGIFGEAVLGLALALALWALWHLQQWRRFRKWQRTNALTAPPGLFSLWREWALDLEHGRQQAQQDAQARERLKRQFDTLLLALPDAAVAVDAELKIEWFNEAASALLNLQDSDQGRALAHVVRMPELAQYLREGDFAMPLELETFAGIPHPVSVQVATFGRRDRNWLITFRDLTQALRLSRLRQEFVANVSHEIKSPLTVVSGYLEMLGEQAERPPDAAMIREMARQCQRMRNLVDDLLELSRLEASELHDRDLQDVRLEALAAEVRREAQAMSSEALHEVRMHGKPGIAVRGRAEELHSALLNLVSNALRYSPDGGTVTIRWKQKDERIRLSVEDQGVGIPPDQVARLTERFYRVDKARSRNTGGTGLGLAIVKHILQRHGAYLQIDSTPGKGSVFTCVFPLPEAPPELR